jgi:bacillolysin
MQKTIALSKWLSGLACLGLLVALGTSAEAGVTEPPDGGAVARLREQVGEPLRVSYHAGTGKVRFIATEPGSVLWGADAGGFVQRPETQARRFLEVYGGLFGVVDQGEELTLMRERSASGGRSFVRFQQKHRGIPVLGGELIVQVDGRGSVVSANGEVVPGIAVEPVPEVAAAVARQRAVGLVADAYGVDAGELRATTPELWVYDPVVFNRMPRGARLVWRLEVTARELLPIQELVLVDAKTGAVVLHFNQIDAAKDRRIHDNDNDYTKGLPGTLVRSEGQAASGITDADAAYDYAGDAYDFYSTVHGRDGIDGAGMPITVTTRYCEAGDCPMLNAYWQGYERQMVFGQGFPQADDVLGHEYTHGVTDYESNLYYYMQSGAINEAFSDIWGEFIDLTNGAGNDGASVRWQVGEDEPNFGAIRDMSDPPAFYLPDRMGSPYYYCGLSDCGGVHYNLGVGSKAAYLMADGDTFNGSVVTGIGITKTAKVWYEVQTSMLTSAGDYADLYDGLVQACTNLIGTEGITAADCQEVQDAVDATEMDEQPGGCAAPDAPQCLPGQTVVNLYYEDFESGPTGWDSGTYVGSDQWWLLDWYATSGEHHAWGVDQYAVADNYLFMKADVNVPVGSFLHFSHSYDFDAAASKVFNGGVVEYSRNGGSTWQDAGPLFMNNGYDGIIGSSWANPLGGRDAFVGASSGYMSSRASLSTVAGPVRFRFRIGTSNTTDPSRANDGYGWFIDDVRLYTCSGDVFNSYLPVALRAYSTEPQWVTVASMDFEGSFPGEWVTSDDNGSLSGEYTWARRACRAHGGSYSGWAVGGGADGSGLSCGSDYPNDADSWLVYGPFSLLDATDAYMAYDVWQNSEEYYDDFCAYASTDGSNFYGSCWTGSTGGLWVQDVFDLADVYTLGDLTGQSRVWVAFQFASDHVETESEGAYVDDIVVRKYAAPLGGSSLGYADLPVPAGADGRSRRPAVFRRE